jgi:hydrogenase nickel incorporation protein HypA/HybF
MHELPITENIIDIITQKASDIQASRITRVDLVIGELSGFAPECIQFYFDFLSKDTLAEGASLRCQIIPAKLRCRECSTTFSPENDGWSCPKCSSINVEIIGGQELYVDNMEVE